MRGQNNQYYGNGQNNQNGYYYNKGNNNPNQGRKNKFILYNQFDQPNQNDENKNSKRNIIIIIVCAVVFLLLIIILLNSCSKKDKNKDEEKETSKCAEDYKLVGNDSYGYVCIPNYWAPFEATGATSGLRYTDVNNQDASYILTLEYVSTSEKTAEEYANELAYALNSIGIQSEIDETTLNDYNVYKVYGYGYNYNEKESDPNDDYAFIIIYFFETNDNKTRYISIEKYSGKQSTDESDEEFSIPTTFSTNK